VIDRKKIDDASFNKLLKMIPPLDLTAGPFVAGGAARRLWYGQDWQQVDVDVFFVNDQQRSEWVARFENMRFGPPQYHSIFNDIKDLVLTRKSNTYKTMSTDNADTYVIEMDNVNIKLQTIKTRYSASFWDLFRDFDFAASCFATDGVRAVALHSALHSVEDKRLVFNNDANTANLALRVLKYQIYGFEPSDQVLRTVADKIANGEVQWESSY
jgi:hypothetical protein